MKAIKLFDVSVDNREQQTLKKILFSKFWASGSGTGLVKKFENKFKNYVNAKSCIAVNSGTAALHLAISLFDIKNKEVILPSLSFVSTANAVLYNGGIPVFADVEKETLCIDPNDVEKKISKKTKMIIPVHFAGMPSNLNYLKKIAKKHNLLLIDDAAHATGSTYNEKMIGSLTDLCCFSFHPVKNLAMPTGGLISINHKDHKSFSYDLSAKRWCGITDRNGIDYNVKHIGWNYYMNEFSAGIGLVQLSKLTNLNNKRKKIAKIFYENIKLENKMKFDTNCSYHFYWIMVNNRTAFRKTLQKYGVETGIHYKPIHNFSLYENRSYDLPVTEQIKNKIVSLPCHPNLSSNDIKKIITLVNKYGK